MFARSASQTSRSGFERAEVLDLVGGLAANGGQRTLDRADDLREGDVVGCARQPVAALGAPPALDEPVHPQLAEDVLEEAQRDRLRDRDASPFAGALASSPDAASSTIARTA